MPKKPSTRLRRVKTKGHHLRDAPQGHSDSSDSGNEKLTATEKQELAAVQWVMHHPQYPNILGSIRLGSTNADIADHFIERGYFQVTRKTAMLYLAAFRRRCPDLCKPRQGVLGQTSDTDGNIVDLRDYDHLFDGNMAALSTEVEMAKLIMVQKQRIAIDYANERGIGKLFGTTSKEIQVLGELLERFHKVRTDDGRVNSSARGHTGGFSGSEDEIRDGLAAIRQDETDRSISSDAIKAIVKGVVRG